MAAFNSKARSNCFSIQFTPYAAGAWRVNDNNCTYSQLQSAHSVTDHMMRVAGAERCPGRLETTAEVKTTSGLNWARQHTRLMHVLRSICKYEGQFTTVCMARVSCNTMQ